MSEVFGGLSAAAVMLPAALAFGLASGLGLEAGIIGCLVLGLIAAIFGGTRAQISGPTGPMTVAIAAVLGYFAEDVTQAFVVVLLAGMMQIIIGLLKLGRYLTYTPYSVVGGFMTGIGVLIILLQVYPFFGFEGEFDGDVIRLIASIPSAILGANWWSLAVGVPTLLVAFVWPNRFAKYVPVVPTALVIGTALAYILTFGVQSNGTDIAIPSINISNLNFTGIEFPAFESSSFARTIQLAAILALLGAIDSLLTALFADTHTNSRHNPNRELVAQGVGNLVAGCLNGLPGAGNTTGTGANVFSGGRTRLSSIVYAVSVGILVVLLISFDVQIPQAVFAAVLVRIGWDILDKRFLFRITSIQRDRLVVFALVLGTTVFIDLIVGVALGLITAAWVTCRQLEQLEMDNVVSVPILDSELLGSTGQASEDLDRDESGDEDDIFSARAGLIDMRGSFTVASSGSLTETMLTDIRDHEALIVDFTSTQYMDDSAAMVIDQLLLTARRRGLFVVISGLHDQSAQVLNAFNIIRLSDHIEVVSDVDTAKSRLREWLRSHDAKAVERQGLPEESPQ